MAIRADDEVMAFLKKIILLEALKCAIPVKVSKEEQISRPRSTLRTLSS